MSKIRINDLARELEVKSKAILDVLTEVGVTEKKSHSSSLEEHEAEKVRAHFKGSGDGHGAGKTPRASHASPDEIKTKIDLSHISKPGDVLKANLDKKQPAAPPAPAAPPKPAAPPAQESKPAAPVTPKPAAPAAPPPVPVAPPVAPVAPPQAPAATTPSVPPRPAPTSPVAPPPQVNASAPTAPSQTAAAPVQPQRPAVAAPPSPPA